MDKALMKLKHEEAQAYTEAAATLLEGAAPTAKVQEARKILEHAKTAMSELQDMIERNGK